MKELMENAAKIAEAIKVLTEAGMLTWKKNDAGDAQADLKFSLRAADLENTDEEVIVHAVLQYDPTEGSEMGTDLTYYTYQDGHPFTALHNTTVYGANKRAAA